MQARRERQHVAIREEIKAVARKLMGQHGTAGISMRGIAGEMGIKAPGLYYYFDNRDALITALILDAFNALADALEEARDGAAGESVEKRLMAVLKMYRTWALAHPVDFQLIYGNPIPGYEAPREVTLPAVVRGFRLIVGLITEAVKGGEWMPLPQFESVPAELGAHLEAMVERDGYDVSLLALYLAVVGWSRIHGIIMLELFDHIQPVVGDSDAFYRVQVEDMLREMGIRI
jgi:AcrR family transcriptional regulator